MKTTRPWAMVPGLLAVLLVALAGVGQGQLGIGGPGEGVKLALLRLPAVQKELKLTDKQKTAIDGLADRTKAARKEVDAASKGQEKAKGEAIPKDMPDPARDAREAALAELEASAEGSLRKLLDADQRSRLAEIALQAEGPRAFLRPEVIRALDIDDAQLDQIREILGAVREQQDQAKAIQKRSAELGTAGLEKVAKEQQKAQLRGAAYRVGRRAMAEIGKILSKKQKDKYTRMLGEQFDLAGLTDPEGRKLFNESADLASALLRMPPVREELKLTDDQKAALDRDEPASRVLKPAQRSRLSQIALQSEGPAAFLRPEVVRSLKLDDEQVARIEEILTGLGDARRQLRDARKQADEARKEQAKEEMESASDRLGKGVMSRIAAVLTRAQRESFRKQLGEPFDLTRLRGAAGQPAPKGEPPAPK